MKTVSISSARIGIIHPGPPATCGGVMAEELAGHIRAGGQAEEVFVERRRKCRAIEWKKRPDRVVEHWTKHFAFFQINARLPKYDVYHFLSERHARLLRYGRRPAVVTVHDAAPLRTEGIYTEGTRRRFRKNMEMILSAEAIVANTRNAKQDMVELFCAPEEKVKVVYPGVNPGVYRPRDKAGARKKLGLPADVPIVLNVGNENKNNNIEGVLGAVATLRKEVPEAILLRVGPKSVVVDDMVAGMKAQRWVIRPGAGEGVTTLYNLYFNAADVYLCMDHYTGYSIQGLSAMASGLPVVSTCRGGLREVAGDAARFVGENVEEAAGELSILLRSEKERSELIEAGILRSSAYKWEKTAKSYLEVYEGVL